MMALGAMTTTRTTPRTITTKTATTKITARKNSDYGRPNDDNDKNCHNVGGNDNVDGNNENFYDDNTAQEQQLSIDPILRIFDQCQNKNQDL